MTQLPERHSKVTRRPPSRRQSCLLEGSRPGPACKLGVGRAGGVPSKALECTHLRGLAQDIGARRLSDRDGGSPPGSGHCLQLGDMGGWCRLQLGDMGAWHWATCERVPRAEVATSGWSGESPAALLPGVGAAPLARNPFPPSLSPCCPCPARTCPPTPPPQSRETGGRHVFIRWAGRADGQRPASLHSTRGKC